MRAFLVASGTIFLLIFLAHVARVVAEGPQLLGQPIFLVTTALSLGVAIWSLVLFRRQGRRPD